MSDHHTSWVRISDRRLPRLAALAVLAGCLALARAGDKPMVGRADVGRLPAEAAELYAAVRPTAADLAWQRIPWYTSLAEGMQRAREENRPLFIFLAGGDPVGRC